MNRLIALLLLATVIRGAGAAAADDTGLEALIAEGKSETLVESMEARLEAEAPTADTHYWLARGQLAQIEEAWVLRKLTLALSAKEHLEAALSLDSDHIASRSSLGRYYLEAPAIAGGSVEKARLESDALLKLDAAAAYALKADIAEAEEDYDSAIAFERKALAADGWSWAAQYNLLVRGVFFEVADATAMLDEAESRVRALSPEAEDRLRLIDYQRGKLAATTGQSLAAGRDGLSRYLTHQPADDEPELVWAEFRLAQIERQLGQRESAVGRLDRLEAMDIPRDLGFALQDERRWHYAD